MEFNTGRNDTCGDIDFLKISREKLNKQRKSGKYCDFIIKTKDGGKFTVHKNILESVSPYFEDIFNSGLIKFETDEYDLELDITSDVLEKVIEFMYTGDEEITKDNVRETINTAAALKLEPLIESCTEVLIETVNVDNCFEILTYAEELPRGEELTKKCAEIISQKIENETDFDSSKIVNLSIDSMKKLLSCDRKVCSDEKLYSTIVQWIQYDFVNRQKYIPDLLDKIQFGNMSYEFALKNLFTNNPLLDNDEFIKRITIVFTKFCEEQFKRGKGQYSMIPLKTKSLFTIIDNEIFMFDNDENTFSRMVTKMNKNQYDGTRELFAYSTFNGDNLFICGGEMNDKILNDCEYYSLQQNSWISLPHMRVSRSCHRAATLKDRIYVCGGKNEDTVEIFDVGKSTWYDGPTLIENAKNPGVCTFGNCIYVLKRNCQRWDPRESNNWIVLPYYGLDNEIFTALGYDHKIYGFTEDDIVTFDIRNNKWLLGTKRYEVPYRGKIPYSCLIKDKIYTISENDEKKFLLHSYNAADLSPRYYSFINMGDRDIAHGLFSM